MSSAPDFIRYQAVVDASARNSSHIHIAELLARHGQLSQRILEVGCSSGYLGRHLRSLGHWVAGIEPSPAAATAARTVLDAVHAGDFDSYLQAGIPDQLFDAIVFGDVLEHLTEPVRALQLCERLLSAGGSVAVSLPNITHGGVRAMLLEGRWTYHDLGILDRTHMRFFSRDGLLDLLSEAGFAIVEMRRTTMSVDALNQQYGFQLRRSTIDVVQSMVQDEDLNTFQFIALARPAGDPSCAREANARWRSGPIESAEGASHSQSQLRALRMAVRSRLLAVGAVLGLRR